METQLTKTECLADTKDYTFLNEWKPFDELNRKVERAILKFFQNNTFKFQATHNEKDKNNFRPVSFSQVNNLLGLAYTSTSAFAALWVCNSGYLFADKTHYFDCFAIRDNGIIVARATDEEENNIYFHIGKI